MGTGSGPPLLSRAVEKQKKRPQCIELDSVAGRLYILWRDGHKSAFALDELRRNCPCAVCRESRVAETLRDDQQSVLSGEMANATSSARGYEGVGRYGIRINWADGHNHGIYSFAALRERDEAA